MILSFPGPAQPDVTCHVGIAGQVTITARRADLRALHAIITALAGNAASTDDSATLIKETAARWERQAHHDR